MILSRNQQNLRWSFLWHCHKELSIQDVTGVIYSLLHCSVFLCRWFRNHLIQIQNELIVMVSMLPLIIHERWKLSETIKWLQFKLIYIHLMCSRCINIEDGVEMCFLCLEYVFDKNKTPFVVFLKDFPYLLRKTSWVYSRSYNLKLQYRSILPHWYFKRKAVFFLIINADYCITGSQERNCWHVMKFSKHFL